MLEILLYIAAGVVGLLVVLFLIAYFVMRQQVGTARIYTGQAKMTGKTVIVTGANSGIGLETAKALAGRGARVIMACRSKQRAMPAVDEVKAACGHEDVMYEELDVGSYQSIFSFVGRIQRQEKKIDVLVNNAGLNNKPERNSLGLDVTFAVNHLGPFLLTYLLLDLLKAGAPSRIVNVSSVAHSWGFCKKNGIKFDKENGQYKYLKTYGTSKLANILHANELAKRLKDFGVTANSLHPGGVNTGIWKFIDQLAPKIVADFFKWFIKISMWTACEGAQTSIFLAVDDSIEGVTGKYFFNLREETTTEHARDKKMSEKLWDVSMELTGLSKKE